MPQQEQEQEQEQHQHQHQHQLPGLESVIVMKPSEPPEDEQPQEQEAKPRRIYQAWKGNNVRKPLRASKFHLLL